MIATLTVRSVVLFTQILLCLQAMFIAFTAWYILLTIEPGAPRGPNAIAAVIASVIAVISFVTAILMKRGRKWAAVTALAIEVLWAVASFISAALPPGPPRWEYFLGGVLSLMAIVGLMLKPVRSYLSVTR
jgi:hypothetical protein